MVRQKATSTAREHDRQDHHDRSCTYCAGYRMEDDLMLVLTRSKGESVKIDGGISVYVLEVDRNKVRLGIDAPDDVIILRSELVGKPKKRSTLCLK